MIKLVLKVKHNIDISKFYKLAFLKKANDGFRPKKSKVLDREEVEKFLSKAPNEVNLMIKVATIFGIAGACLREELMKLTLHDIEEKDDVFIVTIPNTNPHVIRKCVVCKYV